MAQRREATGAGQRQLRKLGGLAALRRRIADDLAVDMEFYEYAGSSSPPGAGPRSSLIPSSQPEIQAGGRIDGSGSLPYPDAHASPGGLGAAWHRARHDRARVSPSSQPGWQRRPAPRLAAGLRHPARTEAQRKARVIAAMRAHGYTKAAKQAKLRGLATKAARSRRRAPGRAPGGAPRSRGPTLADRGAAPAGSSDPAPGRTNRHREAPGRDTALVPSARANKSEPLSLPLLGFLAILPFVLIGLYLLGADYWRRREDACPRRSP